MRRRSFLTGLFGAALFIPARRDELDALPSTTISHIGLWGPDGRLLASQPFANGTKTLIGGDSLIVHAAVTLSEE